MAYFDQLWTIIAINKLWIYFFVLISERRVNDFWTEYLFPADQWAAKRPLSICEINWTPLSNNWSKVISRNQVVATTVRWLCPEGLQEVRVNARFTWRLWWSKRPEPRLRPPPFNKISIYNDREAWWSRERRWYWTNLNCMSECKSSQVEFSQVESVSQWFGVDKNA